MRYLEIRDRAGFRWAPVGTLPGAGCVTLGRGRPNDVVLYGSAVSRAHARVVFWGDQMILQDLGSTWGTLVNGRYIRGQTVLRDGDRVQMGDAQVTVRGTASGFCGPNDVTPRPRAAARRPLPRNMVRCRRCGTANLRNNSVCYNCGSGLLPVPVRAPAGRAPQQRLAARGKAASGVSWTTGLLVALAALVICVLGMILGFMFAAGGPILA